jgi:hypothetical protein
MKQNYIDLIQSELPKLSDDQLWKVLVLVKNTTSEDVKVEKPKAVPRKAPIHKNEPLFTGVGVPMEDTLIGQRVGREGSVRSEIANAGFTGGYGIFEVAGRASSGTGTSVYICFCEPGKFDGMVEIAANSRDYNIANMTIKSDIEGVKAYSLTTMAELKEKLKRLKREYND